LSNLERVALSALKAFAGASGAFFVANQANLMSTPGGSKVIGFEALVAGLAAASKVIQVALEKQKARKAVNQADALQVLVDSFSEQATPTPWWVSGPPAVAPAVWQEPKLPVAQPTSPATPGDFPTTGDPVPVA